MGDASDLNETLSKTDVIFGKQAGSVKAFASTAATSLGQSKQSALDAAATFGQVGQKAGLSGTETAKFATRFTGLASDLASFNNTKPEEAVEAIGAALRGESEPIRKYGVMLDDATLKARAMKMGLIETTTQALTPQQKALAASQEILAQTSKAQGDFARTADGPANKQRILAAQTENLSASLGQSLLPAYAAVLSTLSTVVAVTSQHSTATKAVLVAVAGLATAVLAASAAQRVATAVTTIWTGVTRGAAVAARVWAVAQRVLNMVMRANPMGLVVTAIILLVGALVLAYKKSDTFRAIVTKAWAAIKRATGAVWDWVRSKVGAVIRFLVGLFRNFTGPGLVIKHWARIRAATAAAWSAVKSLVTRAWSAIRSAIDSGVSRAKSLVTNAWNAVKAATSRIWDGIRNAVTNSVGRVLDVVRGIQGKVTGAFAGAASWLWNAGQNIISGLLNGIESMISSVRSKLSQLTSMIPNWKGPSSRDKRLLEPAGQSIIQGLIDGFDRQRPKVKKTLERLTRDVQGFSADLSPRATFTARAALSGAAGGSSGHSTVNIVVQVAPTADKAAIGREITSALDAYYQQGGRRAA